MISTCAANAQSERDDIAAALDEASLVPTDSTFVAFGSMARGEVTSGSDLDWTLLVDGQVDPQHVRIVQGIDDCLVELEKKKPGSSGLFGGLAFSHELIHEIGGELDKNSNTTRRILLMLESCALGNDTGVRDRVIRHLFTRYVGEDSGYHSAHNYEVKVPRFLLNDIVRYWRTITVDYAKKRRDRRGTEWALRNFKLRLSRKLIFASGLAMCLSCQLHPSNELAVGSFANEQHFNQALVEFLVEFSNQTPLSVLAKLCLEYDAQDAGGLIFGSYDRFLAILDDKSKRDELNEMTVNDARSNALFDEARDIARDFQKGLGMLFFGTDDKLTACTQRYGVF